MSILPPCADVCSMACGKPAHAIAQSCVYNDAVYNPIAEFDEEAPHNFIPGTLTFNASSSFATKNCSQVGGAECAAPPPVGGCGGTRFGCCPDGRTAASGPGTEGCDVGSCASTEHGCCPHTNIAAKSDFSNCLLPNHGCFTSDFGCCADGVTPKANEYGANCSAVTTEGCHGTQYGCCPARDGGAMTPALGVDPTTGAKLCTAAPEAAVGNLPQNSIINAMAYYGRARSSETGFISGLV